MARSAINTQDELSIIRRCPHDGPNPYTQISNKLIRDNTISPQCIHMLIMLLSNDEYKWNIRVKQLVNYYKPYMGRDKVHRLIQEAITAGYMKRIYVKVAGSNLRAHTIYHVSESPRFKEENAIKENIEFKLSFRHPEFQDTENQDIEIANSPSEFDDPTYYIKKEHLLRNIIPPIPPNLDSNNIVVSNNSLNSEQSASPLAASAAQCGSVVSTDSGIIPKKPKKIKPVISPEIQAVTNDLVAVIREEMPTVKLASDAVLAETVRKLIDDDHRCPLNAQRVLKFAINDRREGDWPGWAKFMRNANPIAYMRIKFDAMNEAMTNIIKKPVSARVVTDAQGVPVKSKGRF